MSNFKIKKIGNEFMITKTVDDEELSKDLSYFKVTNLENNVYFIWKARSIDGGYPAFSPTLMVANGEKIKITIDDCDEDNNNLDENILWLNDNWLDICNECARLIGFER